MDLQFGDFRLRQREGEVIGPSGPLALSGRAVDLLRALLANPGTLLDKDALFDAAWPGAIVEDNTLQVHVSALRKSLGPGLIATVHGRGYRYVGPQPREVGDVQAPPPMPAALGNIGRFRSECVARESEAEAIVSLLAQHRLVTLVGPGGVGKTTLAVHVATALAPPVGGVWLIDLASIDSGDSIASSLIRALAVPYRAGSDALQSVLEHLQRAPAVLLIDNCEHVQAEVAPIIRRLLDEAPELRVLATSQVQLGLAGERVFRLLPFGVTADDSGTETTSEQFLAHCFEMFGEQLTAEERPLALDLCRRLDGVALALKMAAARASAIGLAAVERQIEAQVAELEADWDTALPRHQSLAASLRWSYDLLQSEQQRTLRLSGVFSGSFSLEAAEAIAGPGTEPRLAELVRRSLVVRDGADRTRFRLLDSTRRFALERLVESGEEAAARDQHAAFMTRHFSEAGTRWETMPDDLWDATYLPDGDNLRSALAWTKSRPDTAGYLELLAAMSRYFAQAQLGAEALEAIESAMPLLDGAPSLVAARLGLAAGEIYRLNAADTKAREVMLPALALLRGGNDIVRFRQALVLTTWFTFFFWPGEEAELIGELRALLTTMPTSKSKAWALVGTGCHMWEQGEKEAGLARAHAGLAMHRELKNAAGLFRSAMNFGEVLHRGGDTTAALTLAEEMLPDLRRRGSRPQLANHLGNVAAYRFSLGDVAGAIAAHQESATLVSRDGSYWHMCFTQNDAERLAHEGDPTSAALLVGLVDERLRESPDGRQETEQMQRDRLDRLLTEALGAATFKQLLVQGNALDLADATQLSGKSGQPA